MKTFKLSLLLAFAGISFMCSCLETKSVSKSGTVAKSDTTAVVIINSEEATTVSLQPNQKFEVLFNNECVGCAQQWHISAIDDKKITAMGSDFKNWTGKGIPGFMGGAQDHVFHFIALASGTSVISFDYFEKKFSLTVEIK